MIFLQILQTFRHLAINVLPLFIITLVVSAVSAEYYPVRSFDRLLKHSRGRAVLISGLFGVLLPATPALRIPMAALAGQGGAKLAPAITFIAGAGAGVSTLILTTMIGFRIAVLRIIVALMFAFFMAVIVARFMQRSLDTADIESDAEMLFSRDFCEVPSGDVDRMGGGLELKNIWFNFLNAARVMLPWLFLSLLLASLIDIVVPAVTVRAVLGGSFAPAKIALVGLPFYFVGGLDIPLIFVLLNKGVNIGALVSLMVAAPLINLPVMSVMGRWIGYRKSIALLAFFWLVASAIGMLLNYLSIK